MKKLILLLSMIFSFNINAHAFNIDLKGWNQISDKHFIVFFKSGQSDNLPRSILNKAEEYYRSIADRIGYSRYQNFWTWDERVSIILFSSKDDYVSTTGRPVWSKGFAISHLSSINQRMIVAFIGEDDFLEDTLPHEIGHLILHDFIGMNRFIPKWFDEGVAQLEERRDDQDHQTILARLIQSGQGMPLVMMQDVSLGGNIDSRYASIFYAESLYIVDFLVKTYGKESFIKLCRNLRDGKNFEEALKSAYYPSIDSLVSLQSKWEKHMTQYL